MEIFPCRSMEIMGTYHSTFNFFSFNANGLCCETDALKYAGGARARLYINRKGKRRRKKHGIIKHAIRNAILPVTTVLGILIANVVTGSFIVENIFGIPGMGEMFVKGIFNRDYPVILGSTVFYSAILILLIFIVDIAYTWIDPRIKVSGRE